MKTRHILCPIDFSECSRGAMRTAIDLARNPGGGSLTLIHVVSPTFVATGDTGYFSADLMFRLKDDAEGALRGWQAKAVEGGATTVDTVCVIGIPWDEIVKLARSRECDLVVMGTHGRSGLKHVLLGSVAEKVIRHAPCSVLVVRNS